MTSHEKYLDIAPEVQEALESGRAVVALESTIISHGMPWPQNVETALSVEKAVRDRGAIPATIAIIGGRLKAGLDAQQIEYLGSATGVCKASRRDLPLVVSSGKDGATTVAATMIVASLAGIRIFATGGIGGVHRGAAESFDISADLDELGHTDVAVVCAGVKSILDIGLTLEYLETKGVPVIGYQTDVFPAFYTRHSAFPAPNRMDSPQEIARMLRAKWDLGLHGGVVIADPVPEAYSMDEAVINEAIEKALKEADRRRIKGKDVTPFLLSEIKNLTAGCSLDANIHLVLNNARLAADIAVAYSRLEG